MGWAKFDDQWASHPKNLAAGLEASGLDARGICYCSAHYTDGFVADAVLPLLCVGSKTKPIKLADALMRENRWTRDDERGGYLIHDYLEYNPTREDAESKREAERVRKDAARNGQGRGSDGRITSARNPTGIQPDTARSPTGIQPDTARNPTGIQPDTAGNPSGVPPVPSRPVPTLVKPPLTPPPSGGACTAEPSNPRALGTNPRGPRKPNGAKPDAIAEFFDEARRRGAV